MDFICPVCGGELATGDKLVKRCAQGHSFDRARVGYYNLLVGASGGTHGDNRDMVEARRTFLGKGYYELLANRVAEIVRCVTPHGGTVLDAGAGEGYYTDLIERTLRERDGDTNVLAFDISKDAAKHLARRNRHVISAVASCYSMPVATSSVDTAVLVFSPFAREELFRVIKPHGKLVIVFPDTEHLFGLKSAIYDTPYKNKPEPTDLEGFTLLSDELLSYDITLDTREDIRALFMMTPYAYRTSAQDRRRVLLLDRLVTSVAFRIVCYRKN